MLQPEVKKEKADDDMTSETSSYHSVNDKNQAKIEQAEEVIQTQAKIDNPKEFEGDEIIEEDGD